MGMLDAIQSEDRIQVKYSEFKALVKGAAKAELLVNAALTDVPHKYMRCMMTGENDLLEEYKSTGVIPEEIQGMRELLRQYQESGISPEDLKELDDIYTEKCKQITDLQAQIKELKAQLEAQGDKPTQPEAADGLPVPAGSEKDLQKLSGICVPASGGWKVKDIADEMHMEPSAVSNAIWRHNKALEGKDDESES